MIKGKLKKQLTIESILEKVTEYDIYRHFMPIKNWELNTVTNSPFSKDDNPSFIIGNKFGKLTHKAFNSSNIKGDCFTFVQQLFNLPSLNEALKIIDKELNLGISQQKVDNLEVIKWKQPKESIIKPPPTIQITTRKPNKEELGYWEQYGITLEDLKRENVYFPKTIYRNKKKIPNTLLTFCYFYPEINKIKIYRPLAPKREKNTPPWLWKWDNSGIPFDYCEGLNNIKNCKYAFLTKSKKDRILLSKVLNINCIADVQAENPSCISEATLSHFKANSEHQVTVFDADPPGKESSLWLTKEYGFKHCNVPDKYLKEGIKDFSDLYKVYGKEPIIEHFKQKGYIYERIQYTHSLGIL